MDCRIAQNKETCPCTNLDCERRGTCCQCISAHLSRQTLPRCCFPAEADKAKDRSFKGFAKAWDLI